MIARTAKFVFASLLLLSLDCSWVRSQSFPRLGDFLDMFPDIKVHQGVFCSYIPGHISHVNILKKREMDRCSLRVVYEVCAVTDTTKGTRHSDRMITLVGKRWCKSYGESMWLGDMQKHPEPGRRGREYETDAGYHDLVTEFTYRDLSNGTVTVKGQMPYLTDRVLSYDEPQPRFEWDIYSEGKEMLGYYCQKAEADFRGRRWTVWFTPEVPVDCGLWKFSGLPGLIMEAYDETMEYQFTASSITQTDEPLYEELPKESKLSRDEYRTLEEKRYADPLAYDTVGGGFTLVYGQDGVFTAGHYRLFYNPMELE